MSPEMERIEKIRAFCLAIVSAGVAILTTLYLRGP